MKSGAHHSGIQRLTTNIVCMGARLFKPGSTSRWLAGMAFTAILVAATMDASGEPYLPALGPVPLRFAVKTTPVVEVPRILKSEPALPASSNAIPPVAISEASPGTNNASPAVAEAPPIENSPADAVTGCKPPESFVFIPALPGMTAQTLAEYFQPVAGRTNATGTAPLLPRNPSFIPPVPLAEASSRATYKTQ